MVMKPFIKWMACWPKPMKPMLIWSFALPFLAFAGAGATLAAMDEGSINAEVPKAESRKKLRREMFALIILNLRFFGFIL
jgi:hypothetical protein